MRRKSYDILFEPKAGMTEMVTQSSVWRSIFYYVISMGAFVGVVTNVLFREQSLAVRFGLLLGILLIKFLALGVYGCFVHGLIEAIGATSGDIRSLLCILGFTALPFLVLTPVALMGAKLGGLWLLLVFVAFAIAFIWWLFLVIRALQVVYIIDYLTSFIVVCFSFLILTAICGMPLYFLIKMLVFKLS